MKSRRNQTRFSQRAAVSLVLAAGVGMCPYEAPAQGNPQWALSAYRVKVVLQLDLPPAAEQMLRSKLPRYLEQRATASIGALWNVDITIPDGAEAYRLRNAWDAIPEETLAALSSGSDKLVLVVISAEGAGYQVRCRVYDVFTHRWTEPLQFDAGRLDALPETVFWALRESFAPVAFFQSDPQDDGRVLLAWKGAALPTKRQPVDWVVPGDILLPILRRTDRDGTPLEDGIEQVPWTYLQVGDEKQAARVFSHTKRPFGVRRRGSVDHHAILARGPREPVSVQLQSKTNNNLPLAGFDVYRQAPGSEETQWVGKSDLQGEVQITPGDNPLELIYVKSGSQVLAKLPITFITDRLVQVPLVDDPVRLEAEAKINLLREKLIDLVARRTILAGRVRKQIKAGEYAQAAALLAELDGLPGRAEFDLDLANQEKLSKSNNALIQRRIDKLFADTRVVLGHFLDARLTRELRTELADAQRATTQ